MLKIEQKLLYFIKQLLERIPTSELAGTLSECIQHIERQRRELTALHQENDELRQRLVKAQQGLVEARDAILKLKGDV